MSFVIRVSECPNRFDTASRDTPASNMSDVCVCRKWGAPHFWHSRAMHLYQHGMGLPLISQWLGHAQLETTLIYAYADTEMKRKAIEQATSVSNPLSDNSMSRFSLDDEETLKMLMGLR